MDRTCLNDNILDIMCKHGTLGSTLSSHLSMGTRKVVCLDRYNVATGYLLDILKCYRPFEDTVTYAHKFVFDRPDLLTSPLTSATVSLTLQTNVLTDYVGTGDGNAMAIHFQDIIDAGGLTIAYLTERVGNVLYVYSYDPIATFADVTTISSSVVKVTVAKTNLQNDLSEILNLWNSLTEIEICNLITLARNAALTGASLPAGGGSGGCNC